MKYLLENTFYRLFNFLHKTRDADDSRFLTLLTLIVIFMFNFMSFETCISLIIPISNSDKADILFVFCVFIAIFLFVYFNKKRYNKVYEKFSKETVEQKNKGRLIFWLYLFLTFLVITISILYEIHVHQFK